MKDFTFKHAESRRPEPGRSLETDERGRLYDPQVRQRANAIARPDLRGAVEAIAALSVAAKLIHLERERWAEHHGLSDGRFGLLVCLRHRTEGTPLSELAGMLNVSPRNVTGLIDNLERDGLVVRVPDPADRRLVLARLTDRGRQRIDALWEQGVEGQSAVTEGFTPEELADLRHMCLRLVRNLRQAPPKKL